jgi:hypothetical protein
MGFGRNSRSLVDISGIFMLVEFGGILGLVDLSGSPRFQFGVRAVYYKAFLLIIGGGK